MGIIRGDEIGVKAVQELAAEFVTLNQTLRKTDAELKEIKTTLSSTRLGPGSRSADFAKQNKQLERGNIALKERERQQKALVTTTERLRIAATKEARQLAVIRERLKEVNRENRATARSTLGLSKQLGLVRAGFIRLSQAAGVTLGIFGAFRLIRGSITVIREFGLTMQTVAGIFRISREDLAAVEEEIRRVGASSVRTANETAQLAESLATLGKTREEIIDLLKPVTDLSIGLKVTSAEAGEFLIQQLNAFGRGSAAAAEFADVIATIRTSTTLNFEKMKDAFAFLSPISRLLGEDLAFTGAIVGILADNGLKAANSGRLLSTAQIKLAKSGLTLQDGLDKINIAIDEGRTGVELLAIAGDLFGARAAKVGVILAENTDIIQTNAQAIRDNGGALQDLVDSQLMSLDAELKILKSRWEDFILGTNQATGASRGLSRVVRFLGQNIRTIVKVILIAVTAWGSYRLVLIAISLRTKLLNFGVNGLKVAMAGLTGGIKAAIVSFKTLDKVTKANIIGALVSVVLTAVVAFKAFASGAKEAAEGQRELNKSVEEAIEIDRLVKNIDEANLRQKKDLLAQTLNVIEATQDLIQEEEILTKENKREEEALGNLGKKMQNLSTQQSDALVLNADLVESTKNLNLAFDDGSKKTVNLKNQLALLQKQLETIKKSIEDTPDISISREETKEQRKAREKREKEAFKLRVKLSRDLNAALAEENEKTGVPKIVLDDLEALKKADEKKIQENKDTLDTIVKDTEESIAKISKAQQDAADAEQKRQEQTIENLENTKEGLGGIVDLLDAIKSGSQQAILEGVFKILETAGGAAGIPGFFKGTTDSPEGLAKLAEHGAEIVQTGKGASLIEDKTVAYLPRHSTVYTASQTKEILNQTRGMANFNLSDSTAGIGNAIKNQTNTLKSELSDVKQAINSIPGYHVDWSNLVDGIRETKTMKNKRIITHYSSNVWEQHRK
ncbi:hypothetical protein LCGC14_0370660 [marine sediment metagenome]|uniref:Phage tail tape measure protein domain-containing protein n=1 Tax=marine sediment metagenome TaxID=412755 RepID=A0A0F9T5A2_9ZZZZ|nr:phage tail tape measure protein [Maribacter sp.]HDZ04900.1 phage tail tape measure protein [Maribacter sp.]